jgi:hydrogenase maturation protease
MALATDRHDAEHGDMTASTLTRPAPTASRPHPRFAVEILLCGSPDRGDDGAPVAAGPLIARWLPADVRLKVVDTLDIDALLAIPLGAGIVIVDTAIGIEPGAIVSIPLNGLIGREDLRARSAQALAFPEVIGLTEMLRGRPLPGRIVAIGAARFGMGKPLSRRVRRALPDVVRATLAAVDLVRAPQAVATRTT